MFRGRAREALTGTGTGTDTDLAELLPPFESNRCFHLARRYGTDSAHMSGTMKRTVIFGSDDKEEQP
jgi:hypothetical protein